MASSQIKIRNKGDLKKLTKVDGEYYDLKGADLKGADLRGVDLDIAHLEGADLQGAHLERAHLESAHLEGADLRGAFLQGAHLEDAQLQGAHLEDAQLQGAELDGADLEGAHLEGAHLEGAQLQHSILINAHLQEAHLEDATLVHGFYIGANLKGAHFKSSYLSSAVLIGANLEDVHFEGAELDNVIFNMDYDLSLRELGLPPSKVQRCFDIVKTLKDQGIKGAIFKGAHLEYAEFERAQLQHANFTGAHFAIEANFKFANLDDSIFNVPNDTAEYANETEFPTQLVAVDFTGAFLRNASCNSVNFKGANFTDAHLEGAIFESHLENAQFNDAHLEGANLQNAHLEGAHFRGAFFVNDDLVGVNLQGVSMQYVDFTGLNLIGVELSNVLCNFSVFRGMNLSGMNFIGTRFIGANLEDVNFQRATLLNADLSNTRLRGADFQDAILTGAVFENANTMDALNLNIIHQTPAAARPREVNPFQIHQAFVPILKNIHEIIVLLEKQDQIDCRRFFNENGSKFSPGIVEKLIEFCKVNGDEPFTLQNDGGGPRTASIRVFLTEIIAKISLTSYDLSGQVKGLGCTIISGSENVTMNNILTAVFSFVNRRSDNFKRNYLEFYIMDCMTAYRGDIGQNTLSCVNGIIERFTTNIPQALADVTPEISEKDTEKSLIRINEIITDTRNIKKRLDDFGGKCNKPPDSDNEDKFTECMKKKYIELYGDDDGNIDEETETEINNYCKEFFQYLGGGGGKKRRTKKRNPNL